MAKKLRQYFRIKTVLYAAAMYVGLSGTAAAVPIETKINFNSLPHGKIVRNQFVGDGLRIRANNPNRNFNLAVAFNSNKTNKTEDEDLQYSFGSRKSWSGGNIMNLKPNKQKLGKILIIQENNKRKNNNNSVVKNPDDEGNRPAGNIFFELGFDIDSFGFDLIDVEDPEKHDFHAAFFNGKKKLTQKGLKWLVERDPSIIFGDNTANRIDPITAAELGIDPFDRVRIKFGGSAGIDNIVYTKHVPEPATLLLMITGLAGLGFARRKKKNS